MFTPNRFVGLKKDEKVIPFDASVSTHRGKFVFDMSVNPPVFLYAEHEKVSTSGWSKAEVEKNINLKYYDYIDKDTFNKYFPKFTKTMSLPSIKKGSVYFNTTTNQVERVITVVDGSLVWTSRHKQEAKPYPKGAFRIANQVEVQNYLAEAQAVKP